LFWDQVGGADMIVALFTVIFPPAASFFRTQFGHSA
jgi:hypothetical protein